MTTETNYANRHKAVFDASSFKHPVHIIGCGGMGSHIATALARMGVGRAESPIHLYDFDKFEDHNRANQVVHHDQIGWGKVRGVRRQLQMIEPRIIAYANGMKLRRGIHMSGVVFLCVDSMDARKTIMQNCLEGRRTIKCVIETRVDATTGISHCIDPNNKRHCDCWWEQCYTDAEAQNMAGCGGTISIISAIHGTVALALKQFEAFARTDSALGLHNRVYQDFDFPWIESKVWPTNPDWD